jgi:transposase
MLMIGFFENIASERGIAERCSDSISIRFFLGYDLTQSTPRPFHLVRDPGSVG